VKGILGDRPYHGFAINAGTEIFPAAPISLSMNYNIGFINESAITEFSGKLNYHIDRYKFTFGYQSFSAGTLSIDGPIIGIGYYL